MWRLSSAGRRNASRARRQHRSSCRIAGYQKDREKRRQHLLDECPEEACPRSPKANAITRVAHFFMRLAVFVEQDEGEQSELDDEQLADF
jgi:hypothetical protein